MPIRIGMQFFPALVGRIQGIEKGDRIGDMDEDRQGSVPQPLPKSGHVLLFLLEVHESSSIDEP